MRQVVGVLVVAAILALIGLAVRALTRTGPRIPRSGRDPDDVETYLDDVGRRHDGL